MFPTHKQKFFSLSHIYTPIKEDLTSSLPCVTLVVITMHCAVELDRSEAPSWSWPPLGRETGRRPARRQGAKSRPGFSDHEAVTEQIGNTVQGIKK